MAKKPDYGLLAGLMRQTKPLPGAWAHDAKLTQWQHDVKALTIHLSAHDKHFDSASFIDAVETGPSSDDG